jgi:hypothetical protein
MWRVSVGGSHAERTNPYNSKSAPCDPRGMRGVRITRGADLQLPAFTIEITDDGTVTSPPIVPRLRTDTWSFWLEDAVEAAVQANAAASELTVTRVQGDEDEVTRVMVRELRATMRAITASAFATDAFYASVKARSPAHPHESSWRSKRTQRHVQVYETLRHHLRLRSPGDAEIRHRIHELFRTRPGRRRAGEAAHVGARDQGHHREGPAGGCDPGGQVGGRRALLPNLSHWGL